jgi:hypothetical protein
MQSVRVQADFPSQLICQADYKDSCQQVAISNIKDNPSK